MNHPHSLVYLHVKETNGKVNNKLECSRASNMDEKLKAKLQSMFALSCSYTLSD